MGKQKRPKRKPHIENPTGLVSVNHFEEVEDFTDAEREASLQKVYDNVQSLDIEEKLSALETLESMSCSKNMSVQIASDGIVKRIGPLLMDPNISVRTLTASALRHIAENGGEKVYTHFFNDDIMTPVCSLLKRDYSEWQPIIDCTDKKNIHYEKEAFIEIVTLLWTLCENSELAIKYANKEGLILILLKYLDIVTYGIDLGIVAAQCIFSLSEDNPVAINELKKQESTFLNLLTLEVFETSKDSTLSLSNVTCIKTLICGLLMYINNHREMDQIHVVNQVLCVLSKSLDIDHIDSACSLVTMLLQEKAEFSRSTQKKIQEYKQLLGAQQQALEILTNLCTEDQESKEVDSDIDDLDEIECEDSMDDNESINDNFCKVTSTLPVELIEVISNSDLLKKIWNKTLNMDNKVIETFSQSIDGKAILKQVHVLRCRAYLCLHNWISSLDIDILGGVEALYSIWCQIGTVVFKEADINDIELLESTTAALRATLQKLTEVQAKTFSKLTPSDIQPMLNGERQCPNANVRVNLTRILGNLALIVANDDNSNKYELMKHISVFLLVTSATESVAWVMAECLDALMDIFSDDETDKLAADIKLTVKLSELIPTFKTLVRQQKRSLGDNMAIISMVNANIARFIRYKEKRLKLLQ